MSTMLDTVHQGMLRSGFALTYGWRRYGRLSAFLDKSQWWAPERLERFRHEALTNILRHAGTTVPFYRQRFAEAGIDPLTVTAATLPRLPLLTKHDIQQCHDQLIAEGAAKSDSMINSTGGSTGQPLSFLQDREYWAWANADKFRAYAMSGYRVGMRWAFLWGSDVDANSHRGWHGKIKDRLVYNMLWINTFDLRRETIAKEAQRLAQFHPKMIVAYVSAATLLAKVVQERNIRGIRPQSIHVSAEVLTDDDRSLLEEVFLCKIFNHYGSREVCTIGQECDHHKGLHVFPEHNFVEIVDDEGHPVKPGCSGRIIVTNLHNHIMPFIRYEIGDRGTWATSQCDCGRSAPLLASVEGRTTDIIIGPSGKMLHGEFFTHLFYGRKGVDQFRVTQIRRDELDVKIVAGPACNREELMRFLQETIRLHGDPAFRVTITFLEKLAPSPSGKHRFVSSEIPPSPRITP